MTAYEPPRTAAPPSRPVRISGFAIASLVLGIVWVFWVGSVLALIFGYVALRQVKRSQGSLTGRGMAIAGVVLGWVGVGLLALTIVLAAVGSSSKKSSSSSSATTASSSATTAQAAAPAGGATIFEDSGSGTKTTQKFSFPDNWDLAWTYDCSNFGSMGNFIVMFYDEHNVVDYATQQVNQLGPGGQGVEHYHSNGTKYLEINSECAWTLKATNA